VTDTHPNSKYAAGAYVAGAFLTLAGVALVANAQGKNEHVTCGSGGGTPNSGDRCSSEAGAWRELGAVTIGAGLGAILGGVIVQTRKPVVELKELPSEQQVRTEPNHQACGTPAALEGAVIRATLSSGGSWTGTADRTGAVRIDLSGAATRRGTRALFTLESVRPDPTTVALAGSALGEVDLEPVKPTSRLSPAAAASASFIDRGR
jgi:hypothetical protein